MINGLSVTDPSLKNLFDNSKTDIFQTLNCVKIGTIVSFDKVKRTAEVQISFKRSLSIPLKDGTRIQSYPLLLDCPVITLQGGGGVLSFPIKEGDECIVLFSDSNIDAWFNNGGQALPMDGRRHDISDGIAIVGLNSKANPLVPAVTASELALTYSEAKIAEKNGKITLQNATFNFITAMDTYLIAMNAFLALVAADTVILPATKAGAGVMQTANTALKTQLDLLFY